MIDQLTNAINNNQDISDITSLLQDKDKDKDETLDLKLVNEANVRHDKEHRKQVSKPNRRGQQKRK